MEHHITKDIDPSVNGTIHFFKIRVQIPSLYIHTYIHTLGIFFLHTHTHKYKISPQTDLTKVKECLLQMICIRLI